MAIDLFTTPQSLLGRKIGGLSITRYLDTNANSVWYEAQEDAGEKRLVYVYKDSSIRDKDIICIHNFHTTMDKSIVVDECEVPLFFIVGDYRRMMDKALRDYLMDSSNFPLEIGDWQAERVLGHGYKGVTLIAKRKHGLSTEYALKLTIAEEYENNSYLPEIDRMVELARKDRNHFPQIHACGEWECLIADDDNRKLVYFVEDYMPGTTLEKYMESAPSCLDVVFLSRFVREMLTSLMVLQTCDLMHDDLHAGNIMINDSIGDPCISLIDFGSTKPVRLTTKSKDDIRNLAMHIAQIINTIETRHSAKTIHENYILSACQALHAVINDDDPMRRSENAQDLLTQFDRYFSRGSVKQKLERPFDFGNAEEVTDNSLLQKLAAKSFPWRDKIECSANILIIGPRGCGKTTVFRSMSFNCLVDAGEIENALSRPYIGLYISCNKEFRQRFSAINPEILRRRDSEIRHYFNLIVLREFIRSLISCHRENSLVESDIRKTITFLSTELNRDLNIKYSAIDALHEIEGLLIRETNSVRMNIWNDQACENLSQQGFISDLTKFGSEEIGPFHGKTFYLFVDDYTERKIPREAQRAINHILFVPNAIYKSKISSEVFGVPPDQTFGNFLDQDRDYKEWNLGTLYYLKLPSRKQKVFLAEIVNNRLKMCGYQGKVFDIIGESEYAEGKLERALKQEADARKNALAQSKQGVPSLLATQNIKADLAKQGKIVHYHGWDTICDLCTGDVSNVLEVLSRMYEECNITKSQVARIEPPAQDAVIQGYSLQYISKIKGIPRYGEKLFQIVDAFGNMCAQLLREYPLVPHGDRFEPYQLIRIELDEGFVRNSNDLLRNVSVPVAAQESQIDKGVKIVELLQRYCIFIDAQESRSRRNTLANKMILRRIFCPAFRTGLVNSESFTLDKLKWQSFCSDPKDYCDRYVKQVVAEAKRKRGGHTEDEFFPQLKE